MPSRDDPTRQLISLDGQTKPSALPRPCKLRVSLQIPARQVNFLIEAKAWLITHGLSERNDNRDSF